MLRCIFVRASPWFGRSLSENLDFRYPPRKLLLVKSGVWEIFACGIRNPESGKVLLVKSGIREIFACGIRNPGNFCSWNPESGKFLLVEFKSLASESGIQLKESGIPWVWPVPLTKNPESSTREPESKAWNPEFKTVLSWGEYLNG